MKTIHKAFLFAAFAMLAAVLIVLPVDGSSADTDVQIANSGEGSTWVQISFDEGIEAPLTLTVYDSDRQQIDSVELPNVDGMTVYTFQLNKRLDTASSYHMTVSSGGQTYYSDLDAAAVQPVLRYIVVVDESDNGSVEATPVFGASGTEVSLKVTPDSGYALKTLEVSGTDVSS